MAMTIATEREYRRLARLVDERDAAALAAKLPIPGREAHAEALSVSKRALARQHVVPARDASDTIYLGADQL